MWSTYINAKSVDETLSILKQYKENARIIAGGTDLVIEIKEGVRRGTDILVDISRISGLDQITLDENKHIHIGPAVTHNQCVASKLINEYAYPLARACWEVGSPQIRNRGTIAGNLITASPANDTIAPLLALDAEVTLESKSGPRKVKLSDFYTGLRKTVLLPEEMLVDISFPVMKANQRGVFIKYGLRKAQAISVVNLSIILTLDGTVVTDSSIILGSVAPVVIHAIDGENYLIGKKLSSETIHDASLLIMKAAKPISDIRSTADYRLNLIKVLSERGLTSIANHEERTGYPDNPVFLWGRTPHDNNYLENSSVHNTAGEIHTIVNGKPIAFKTDGSKSLLVLLRDEGMLTGTKNGCSEGECGACTVFLDGAAVMSCLVPAPRANMAEIQTIESIGTEENLHIIQKKFIEEGAVQCGFCTPGFIMSAVKLLEEAENPTRDQIKQAISGNLCRCTGYYKIISAIEKASVDVINQYSGI